MNKFIKEHGQMILWFIFVVFMLISLSMVFTHGIRYAMVVFIFSVVLLCPPIIKFIQQKTRIKKFVVGIVSATVMLIAMLATNHFSEAKKEEQLKILQEKKEEREKKIEEQAQEQKKNEEEAAANSQTPPPAPKRDLESEMKKTMEQIEKEKQAAEQKQAKNKKVVVRASKKSGQYYTPGHPSYNKVAANNLLVFNSEEAAQKAGYKKAA